MSNESHNGSPASNGKRHCCALTKTGKPCPLNPLKGIKFCFIHDPASADARHKARSQGGRRSRELQVPKKLSHFEILGMPKFRIKTVADIVKLLGFVMNAIISGKIDPKIGTSIGFLCNSTINALGQMQQTVDIQVKPTGGLRPETISRIENEINLI